MTAPNVYTLCGISHFQEGLSSIVCLIMEKGSEDGARSSAPNMEDVIVLFDDCANDGHDMEGLKESVFDESRSENNICTQCSEIGHTK